MTKLIYRSTLAAFLTAGMFARADDAPKPDTPKPADKPSETTKPVDPPKAADKPSSGPQLHSAGQITAKLGKSSDGSVTIKVPTPERSTSTSTRRVAQTRVVEKDKEYDLTADAKVRWHDLPKKPDGKAYTDAEYQSLREPSGAPGYKAEKHDLKPGQTVRLYLSRAGKDDDPVVTMVVIVADAPKHDDKKK